MSSIPNSKSAGREACLPSEHGKRKRDHSDETQSLFAQVREQGFATARPLLGRVEVAADHSFSGTCPEQALDPGQTVDVDALISRCSSTMIHELAKTLDPSLLQEPGLVTRLIDKCDSYWIYDLAKGVDLRKDLSIAKRFIDKCDPLRVPQLAYLLDPSLLQEPALVTRLIERCPRRGSPLSGLAGILDTNFLQNHPDILQALIDCCDDASVYLLLTSLNLSLLEDRAILHKLIDKCASYTVDNFIRNLDISLLRDPIILGNS